VVEDVVELRARSGSGEDELTKAVARGGGQYVLMGAGLDTFAYRNPHPGLRVFEVDHPVTQRWKRSLLEDTGIVVPRETVFVPVNFERDSLPRKLAEAGFRADEPAFFAWLGVVPYLTENVFVSTVKLIAFMPESAVLSSRPQSASITRPVYHFSTHLITIGSVGSGNLITFGITSCVHDVFNKLAGRSRYNHCQTALQLIG
jgi:methyltransferase (TIGR00027 family)